MEYKILNNIKSPEDVKKLNDQEVNNLCAELRSCIIDTVSKNGGHLASNLGSVELTVALHRIFSSPKDAIIFDVGHQCYSHKLLTGRFDLFSTIRTENGISGFMRPSESEHDQFVTGHSSNSISAAYGIYKAKRVLEEEGTAVAVIGDGAMTGGMAYEALNNAGSARSNFIVVLNDNKMSISRNVGAIARGFTKLRNQPKYHNFKFALNKILEKIPFIGQPIYRFLVSFKNYIKSLVYRNNFFEALGFNYLGPVNGHDVKAMEALFRTAVIHNRPSLIHVITTKGKGYPYAESSPKNYHGVSPFDIETGTSQKGKECYSEIAGKTLCSLAEKNSKICAVTAAMTVGTGLSEFAGKYRDRFFDVGIAEQHAVTFSAGLVKGGAIPFFVVYSSFLQRAYDQVLHDAAIANLPLKLLVDRAGIVGEDGESHQGLFDVAFLSSIPNINIYSPSCYSELEKLIINTADNNELCAIRYPRGCENKNYDSLPDGDFNILSNNSDKAIVTYGRLFSNAIEAQKATGCDIIKLNRIYPLSEDVIKLTSKYKEIHFFEETVARGSVSECLGKELLKVKYNGDYYTHTVKDEFVPSMTVSSALKLYELDSDSMIKYLKN